MSFIPVRYLICLMLSCIGTISILNRLNVNVAITSMVREDNHTKEHPDMCPSLKLLLPKGNESLSALAANEAQHERFNWSPEMQGIVMGCFFWTYFLCQTPSGFIAGRFGGYVPICVSLVVSGIVSIVAPFVTHISVYILVALRVILGIVQAAIFPGLFVLACSWVPLHERSSAIAFADVSANIGSLVSFFISGFVIKAYGWKMMFWLPGTLSLLTAAIVIPFLRNNPEDHRFVSKTELDLIRGRDKKTASRRASESNKDGIEYEESLANTTTREAVPWRSILTNGPVWAMLLFRFARGCVTYLQASEMPTYVATVLHEDVVISGLVSSVNCGIHIITALVMTKMSEVAIVRGFLTRTNCRKSLSLLSGFMSAVTIMLIPIFRCNRSYVRVLYAANGFFVGCGIATDSTLPAEMSTKFHGILYAIANLSANIPGFLIPMLSGAALESFPDRWMAWNTVFFSIGSLLICANLLFLVMASAKRQDFDLSPRERSASRRLSSLK